MPSPGSANVACEIACGLGCIESIDLFPLYAACVAWCVSQLC
jgi:hypothetical protein